MAPDKTSEQRILEALRGVPSDQWPAVLRYLISLQATKPEDSVAPISTASDLLGSELIGIWKERPDITNNQDFAQKLRKEAERRSGTSHAAGH
jgi:hypothetical protein